MQEWSPEDIARAAGAQLISSPAAENGPETVVIDSRAAGPGALFIGLKGANDDGGRFATQALDAGAWGVLTTEEHAGTAHAQHPTKPVLATPDPLKALQRLATQWRRHLNPHVIGVTGSTGKTSTKDLLNAILTPHRRTVASRANFNTEIGLPLEILSAPSGTEVLDPGDGDARPGPDRRARGHRRAGHRHHRQRRAGPPRAARIDRGDRGDQGRTHQRPPNRRHRDHPRQRAAAEPAHPVRRPHGHVRPGRRRPAHGSDAWTT